MPKLLTKSEVYFEYPEWVSIMEDKSNVKKKKKLQTKVREVILIVVHEGILTFIQGTSYGYYYINMCQVYVEVHSALGFLKELPEFDSISLSGHYYILNIHKKFLMRAR